MFSARQTFLPIWYLAKALRTDPRAAAADGDEGAAEQRLERIAPAHVGGQAFAVGGLGDVEPMRLRFDGEDVAEREHDLPVLQPEQELPALLQPQAARDDVRHLEDLPVGKGLGDAAHRTGCT